MLKIIIFDMSLKITDLVLQWHASLGLDTDGFSSPDPNELKSTYNIC